MTRIRGVYYFIVVICESTTVIWPCVELRIGRPHRQCNALTIGGFNYLARSSPSSIFLFYQFSSDYGHHGILGLY